MTKLLNENNAKHVFSSENSGAHSLMSKEGVKYTSAAGFEYADPNRSYISNRITSIKRKANIPISPNRSYITNRITSKGGTSWVSYMTKAPEYLAKFRYDTQEISHGSFDSQDKSLAQTMVKNAEKEIAQNAVLKSRQAYTM